jgi:ComF family protein
VEPTAPACRACADQANGWGFDRARAAAVYEGPLRLAIQRFKYNRAEALGEPLGAFLANRCVVDGLLGDTSGIAGYDAVVPVPIHPVRARSRGFNQALLLAAPVAGLLGAPLAPELVRRVRKTPPQVGLTGDARRANPLNAFAVPAPDAVAGRRVLLIDDVFTTGATVSACAAALKAAGARRVDVATLAAGG